MDDLLRRFFRQRYIVSASSRGWEWLEGRHPLSGLPLAADPATANAAFVGAVYQDVLGRQPDAAGLTWGTAQVDSGQPRFQFIEQVADSQEADADFIDAVYRVYLGRNADETGLKYWVHEMAAGVSNQEIEALILASQEFYSRAGGSHLDWIQAAYRSVLGRGAEAQAVTWAESQLQSAGGFDRIALTLAMSTERSNHVVEQDVSEYQIQIDPSISAALASELARGEISEQQLSVALLATSEYFDVRTGVPVSTVPVPNVLPLAQKTIADIAAKAATGTANVVFVGDSITQLWSTEGISDWNQYFAPLHSLNAGVAGDTTQNVLWRLDHGNLTGISPKLAVLMIGVNDLTNSNGASDIAAGITAVVEKLQSEFPGVNVLLLGLLPAGQPADQREIAGVNERIKPLADGEHVWFVDAGSRFLNSDGSLNTGLYQSDNIHPNAQGYAVLAKAIAPWVQALS
ncbi:MAG TPA: GDSL-type esterase/lipase family protein [Pirellulales bacterium]|nr:GDSL-type esterase/lipase family protein [Pirellulales bacterium]